MKYLYSLFFRSVLTIVLFFIISFAITDVISDNYWPDLIITPIVLLGSGMTANYIVDSLKVM